MSNSAGSSDGPSALLRPKRENVSVDERYFWVGRDPRPKPRNQDRVRSVWYVALPLSSATRGSHSGGGKDVPGGGDQHKYRDEGTVYPHGSLIEMMTYQREYFPQVRARYLDVSHEDIESVLPELEADPPDVVALTVYTATYVWALIFAAHVKRINPDAVIVLGNDHATLMRNVILFGEYGQHLVDFVGTGNNGPYTMMALLHVLRGELPVESVPSVAYRRRGEVVDQPASTFPLASRMLPNYELVIDYLEKHYDRAFRHWYGDHYELQRMVTMPLDSGCHWGEHPKRRCKHCAIQGLTPKATTKSQFVPALERLVEGLRSNVYAAGDSTFGFSRGQWRGDQSFLNDLAEAAENSPVLKGKRFMLAYGLVDEFLKSAKLCAPFMRTWNVGLEAFDPKLLKHDSKGINHGPEKIHRALELARSLDYRLYVSGILGLPGTTQAQLRSEVNAWLSLVEEYRDHITNVSVAVPGVIPGSRMYWDCYSGDESFRRFHRELIPARKTSEYFVSRYTEVTLEDVEAAVAEVGAGVLQVRSTDGSRQIKFGGHMLGGTDPEERRERALLQSVMRHVRHPRVRKLRKHLRSPSSVAPEAPTEEAHGRARSSVRQ